MGRYLNEFASIVPAIQGKQILELLNSEKDSGEIRTLSEYQTRLQELTAILKNTDPQPTYKLYPAIVGKPIRSDAFNLMLTLLLNDLETSFKEIQNIAEVLQIHKTLINENILNNLKFAINDLDNKILIQEFLNSDQNGFTLAQFNTFKQGDQLSSKRSDATAGNTFVDNQSGGPISAIYDATVDLVGEKLIMAPQRTKFLKLKDAKLLIDAETRLSEIDVEFPGSNIRNIIDNETGTYWVRPILLGAPDKSGVIVKVEAILPGYQDINFVELEPATLAGYDLEQIEYVDVNTEIQLLDVDPVFVDKKIRLDFSVVTTKKLIFKFNQKTYKNVQYSYNQDSRLWDRAIAQDVITLDDFDKTQVNDELLAVLNSEELRSLNDITAENEYQDVNMTEYLVGLDNIKLGFTQYYNLGLFVSSVLEGNNVGIFGLQTEENRISNLSGFPVSSFEYNVFKQNFASDGSLVDSEEFNILPAGHNTITHERLIFNETFGNTDDTGTLRFYPDTTGGDPIIYKDFVALTIGTSTTETSPITGGDYIHIDRGTLTPGSFKIRLDELTPSSIYTVSYTPKYSGAAANSEIWLNKQRTMKLRSANIVEFTNERPNATVVTSKLYLTILMRNNSSDDTNTTSLEQYRLLIGTIDPTRFIE